MSGAAAQPFLFQLLSVSIEATQAAGKIIRRIMKEGSLATIDKAVNDPQTEADRQAQQHIVSTLKSIWPTLPIVAEEGSIGQESVAPIDSAKVPHDSSVYAHTCPADLASLTPEKVVVWCDPLDGTREFTAGLVEAVTVLVGIAVNGRPKAGVVYQPFYGEHGRVIWGVVGLGSFGYTYSPPPKDRFIISTTRSHATDLLERAVQGIRPQQVLKVGGAGNKVIQLLEGATDAYVFPIKGTSKWDTCAPEACLVAAGGVLSDRDGRPIDYSATSPTGNVTGLIAALTPATHKHCLERVQAVL